MLAGITLALTAAAASADAAAVARLPSPTSRSTFAFLSPSLSPSLCPSSAPSLPSFSFSASPMGEKESSIFHLLARALHFSAFPAVLYPSLSPPCPLLSRLLVLFLFLLPSSHFLPASPLPRRLQFCCPGVWKQTQHSERKHWKHSLYLSKYKRSTKKRITSP